MKITVSYWNKWYWGRHRQIFDLPMCKDGYYRKKPLRAFFGALVGLKGRNIRIEGVSDGKV